MLIVITLVTILAGMAMANYRSGVVRAREAVLKEDLFRLRDAIDQFYADKGQYPADLQELVSEGYIRRVPEDPFTESPETWVQIPAEFNPQDPAAEPGIFDVKSGSDATGLDGTAYAEW